MKDYTQVERDNAALTIREYAFGQMNMLRMLGDEDAANNLQQAINVAIAALRGSQPDPEPLDIVQTLNVWNTAMGQKGGAEGPTQMAMTRYPTGRHPIPSRKWHQTMW